MVGAVVLRTGSCWQRVAKQAAAAPGQAAQHSTSGQPSLALWHAPVMTSEASFTRASVCFIISLRTSSTRTHTSGTPWRIA